MEIGDIFIYIYIWYMRHTKGGAHRVAAKGTIVVEDSTQPY